MSVFGQRMCLPSQKTLCSYCSPCGWVRFGIMVCTAVIALVASVCSFSFPWKIFFFFEGCVLQCLLQQCRLLSWCIFLLPTVPVFFLFPLSLCPPFFTEWGCSSCMARCVNSLVKNKATASMQCNTRNTYNTWNGSCNCKRETEWKKKKAKKNSEWGGKKRKGEKKHANDIHFRHLLPVFYGSTQKKKEQKRKQKKLLP